MYNKLKPANDVRERWVGEIHEVYQIGVFSYQKIAEPGQWFYYEPCKGGEADVWLIEGIDRGGENIYIGEYQTRRGAIAIANAIKSMYPHLTGPGIFGGVRRFFKTNSVR